MLRKLFFGNNMSQPVHDAEASRHIGVVKEDRRQSSPLSESVKKKKLRRKPPQNQHHHHSLYGTMITIESPVTTPKVSHVTAKRLQQERQQQHQESSLLLSSQQRRDSMPDLGDNIPDSAFTRPCQFPSTLQQRSRDDDSIDYSDHYLEGGNDDDENDSLSSSYSDHVIRTDRNNNNNTDKQQQQQHEQDSLRSTSTQGTQTSVRSIITQSVASVVDATFRIPGKPSSIRDFGGTASIPNEILNLIKNIVGAGAFGLPRYVRRTKNGMIMHLCFS